MPRNAPKRAPTSNSTARTTIFPASTLARSSRSLTSSNKLSARLADIGDLDLLIGCQRPIGAIEKNARQREDRVQRRSELVAHIREEARFHFIRAAQMIRLLVQFSIERNHATIRIVELAVQTGEFLLAMAQLLERLHQLLILFAQFVENIAGFLRRDPLRQIRQRLRRDQRRASWQQLPPAAPPFLCLARSRY